MPRPTLATIHCSALAHNLQRVRSLAPNAKVFAVIKANAYGHGFMRVAHALQTADGFALLEFDAAIQLREAGFTQEILLLEGCFDLQETVQCAQYQLTIVVHNRHQLVWLQQLPAGAGLKVYLKVNSGMHRLGFAVADVASVYQSLTTCPAVSVVNVMTHFADADGAGITSQLQQFDTAIGGGDASQSLANSATIIRYPQAHRQWVRAGIMLYGSSPIAGVSAAALDLRPAMTLSSEIISVCRVKAGDCVGYGGTYKVTQPMRLGVVACGYADGYPRHAPTGTPVRVGDHLTHTVGRVSMDLLSVDLTPWPELDLGAPVVLWGEGNPIDDVAQAAQTISYELLCALNHRVAVRKQE